MKLVKPVLFILLLLPLLMLIYGAFTATLGADPQKEIVHETGTWTLYLLMLTLTMTPLRRWTGMPIFIQVRRMIGLFSFFYLAMHMLSFIALYMGFEWLRIGEEIMERPYITLGMLAFILMLPLAITSNRYSMKRLGSRWHKLHRLVYIIAVLGVWHFYWQVKSDINKPIFFIFLLSLLLGLRIYWANSTRTRTLNNQ